MYVFAQNIYFYYYYIFVKNQIFVIKFIRNTRVKGVVLIIITYYDDFIVLNSRKSCLQNIIGHYSC